VCDRAREPRKFVDFTVDNYALTCADALTYSRRSAWRSLWRLPCVPWVDEPAQLLARRLGDVRGPGNSTRGSTWPPTNSWPCPLARSCDGFRVWS